MSDVSEVPAMFYL